MNAAFLADQYQVVFYSPNAATQQRGNEWGLQRMGIGRSWQGAEDRSYSWEIQFWWSDH